MAMRIPFTETDFPISQLNSAWWRVANEITVDRYWSGAAAPEKRQCRARLMWSPTGLYVRFEANRNEPLVVSEAPELSVKTIGLWERDVYEIFIAPDRGNRYKYYEFEIAPTGEWIDVSVEVKGKERVIDLEYTSGMESAARSEKDRVVMAMKAPWTAFGKKPKPGDVWVGNLFRCVGKGETRGYLAWRPTMTKEPNFHVPEAFGEFEFVH